MTAHPRVCGENLDVPPAHRRASGSSPRVRGKLDFVAIQDRLDGLIPACAGKTAPIDCSRSAAWAHPRVCGENRLLGSRNKGAEGSSPRVRGKPTRTSWKRTSSGLIPACAGKTW